MRTIDAIGAASCIAGNRFGCCAGPRMLRHSGMIGVLARKHGLLLNWQQVLDPHIEMDKEAALRKLFYNLSHQVQVLVKKQRPFVFMGGDHACAMGVWGGVLSAIHGRHSLGLIWIDAHMDSHTFATSDSGNIHGMPLAALLGQADPRLARIYGQHPFLDPSRLVLIGVRSYEKAEQQLLKRLGVQVYDMARIRRSGGLSVVLRRVLNNMRSRCQHYGITIDLDGIDPRYAPGVGVPVAGGLSGAALCQTLKGLGSDPALIGLEIAEFNPLQDKNHRTEQLVEELIGSVYGDRWS
ncbi:arginase [Pseudomonadota bacterium]